MALTIYGLGTAGESFRFAHDDLILTLQEGTPYTYRWQYVLQIKKAEGVTLSLITTMKAPPNENNAASFNINRVIRSVCDKIVYDQSQQANTLGYSNGNVSEFQFVAFSEYAATENGPILSGPTATGTLYMIDGGAQTYADGYQAATANTYKLQGITSRALTTHTNHYVKLGDRGGLAVLANAAWGSEARSAQVVYYDASGSVLNSGSIPIPAETALSNNMRYVWLYPDGLEQQTADTDIQPSAAGNAGWSYYRARIYDATLSNERSQQYFFYRLDECGYGQQEARFMYLSSLGTWQWIWFRGQITELKETERSYFTKSRGNYQQANATTAFNYTSLDRGRAQIVGKTTTKYECNSELLTDEQSPQVIELLNSRSVYINTLGQGASWYPCIVNTKSVEYKRQNFDEIVSYSIEVEMSNESTVPKL